MQFGGIIYLQDPSQRRDISRQKDAMTPMKLSDPEIAPRVILAMVDGDGLMTKNRDQLKDSDTTTWGVQTRQFTNTKDSAWSIVDTILGIPPIELCYIQDELDTICATLPKQFPKPVGIMERYKHMRPQLTIFVKFSFLTLLFLIFWIYNDLLLGI